MEAKVLGIGEFRKHLSERVEAAYIDREPTVVKHGSRNIARAVLIPYDVGTEPLALAHDGDEARSYVVSAEWFEKAKAALAKRD